MTEISHLERMPWKLSNSIILIPWQQSAGHSATGHNGYASEIPFLSPFLLTHELTSRRFTLDRINCQKFFYGKEADVPILTPTF